MKENKKLMEEYEEVKSQIVNRLSREMNELENEDLSLEDLGRRFKKVQKKKKNAKKLENQEI